MWILSIFRSILAFIDQLVVWIIVNAYGLFTEIIDVKFFDNETIQYFSRRIYALLAIFMLFKLAFSLINYLVNPDNFSDKEKGFGKIVTNVFVVLLLIAVTPTVFDQAYELQKMIINNHVIENVILGMPLKDTDSTGSNGKDSARGQNMAYITYSAFINPASDYPGIDDKCTSMYVDGQLTGECASALRTALSDEEYNTLNSALQEQNPYALLDNDLITEYKDNKFVMSYIPIISTISGGLVAWVLIMFCIEVAIRLVKLGFLQLVAPIPIISYIDPKSGKDGLFKKWLKECGKTYLDVFMRIAAISFCIFLVNILMTNESTYISTGQKIGFNPLLRVFILIGILLFAQRVPKLIEDLTGLKLGGFTLNPLKKLGESGFLTAAVGGLTGGIAGAASGAMASFATSTGPLKGLKALGGGVGGLFSGAGRGLAGGYGEKGKGIGINSGLKGASMIGSQIQANAGTTFFGRTAARMQGAVGLKTGAEKFEGKKKALETYAKFKDTLKNQSNFDITDLSKDEWLAKIAGADEKIYHAAETGVKGLKQYYEDLQNAGASYEDISKARGVWEKAQQEMITRGSAQLDPIKEAAARFINENKDIFSSDAYSSKADATYGAINDGYIAAKNAIVELENSAKYEQAQKVKEATPKKK